jgi:hypothetical protein
MNDILMKEENFNLLFLHYITDQLNKEENIELLKGYQKILYILKNIEKHTDEMKIEAYFFFKNIINKLNVDSQTRSILVEYSNKTQEELQQLKVTEFNGITKMIKIKMFNNFLDPFYRFADSEKYETYKQAEKILRENSRFESIVLQKEWILNDFYMIEIDIPKNIYVAENLLQEFKTMIEVNQENFVKNGKFYYNMIIESEAFYIFKLNTIQLQKVEIKDFKTKE